MRISEIITESRLGDITTPDFKIFVSSHLVDQIVKRGLPMLGPDKVIRKLKTVKTDIAELADGEKFWAYDSESNISLGMRKMSNTHLILATAVEGKAWNSQVKQLDVGTMTEQELTEQPFTYKGYPCTKDCSGHMAGYAWAARNDIDDEDYCGGSSNSFWEGCKSRTEGK
jgi:hypothetical protein